MSLALFTAIAGLALAAGWTALILRAGPVAPGRAPLAWLAGLAFAGAAVAGFGGLLLHGEGLRGWPLLAHLSAAGLFTVVLPVWLYAGGASRVFAEGAGWGWLALWLAVIMMGAVGLAMMPWFGTAGQHTLIHVHRYAALGVAAVLLILALRIRGPGVLISNEKGE